MKRKLNEEQENVVSDIVERIEDDNSKDLIDLMRKCNISNGVIMLTYFGIGTHTEYYRMLYNSINNNLDKVNDNWIKKEVKKIFRELDKLEDE